MSREQIVVRVGVDGLITAETIGIKGERCLESIALLEDLLDSGTFSSTFTDEYLTVVDDVEIEGSNEAQRS